MDAEDRVQLVNRANYNSNSVFLLLETPISPTLTMLFGNERACFVDEQSSSRAFMDMCSFFRNRDAETFRHVCVHYILALACLKG